VASKGSCFIGVLFLAYMLAAHIAAYYIGDVKHNPKRISSQSPLDSDVGFCTAVDGSM
jgi:hypothetical protein